MATVIFYWNGQSWEKLAITLVIFYGIVVKNSRYKNGIHVGGVECRLRKNCFTFFFFFSLFSQLQKVTRKKQQLDQKLFVVSAKGRQGKLEKKRERGRNQKKETERKGERDRDRQWDHSPVWGTHKKSTPLFVSSSLLSFFFPFFLSPLSFSQCQHPPAHSSTQKSQNSA